jgi:hypothetical protein
MTSTTKVKCKGWRLTPCLGQAERGLCLSRVLEAGAISDRGNRICKDPKKKRKWGVSGMAGSTGVRWDTGGEGEKIIVLGKKPSAVAHACIPSYLEAEVRRINI